MNLYSMFDRNVVSRRHAQGHLFHNISASHVIFVISIIVTVFAGSLLFLDAWSTPPPALAATSTGGSLPGAFSASASGATNAINLTWSYSSGATSYNVYSGSTGGTIVSGLPSSQQSYSVTGLACGTAYSYFINASNAYGGTNSSTVYATTSACPVPPAGPTNVGASNIGGPIKIEWFDPVNLTNVTGYRVYRNLSLVATIAQYNAATHIDYPGCQDSNIVYGVTSYGPTGESSASSASAPETPCAPAAPTVSVQSQTSIIVSWPLLPVDSSITAYYIYRNGGYIASITPKTRSSYADTVGCNTTNTYTLVAYNGAQSATSAGTSGTTYTCSPGIPSGVNATGVNSGGATVNWTRNSPLNDSGFYVYANSVYKGWAGVGGTSAGVALSPGTTYSFYVNAYVNGTGGTFWSGNSATSPSITTPPGGFTLSQTRGTPSSVTLTWTASAGASGGYTIFRNRTAITGTSGTSYTDSLPLSCGTGYSYYISAAGPNNTFAYSNTITGQTVPCTPTTLSTSPSGTSITVSWSSGGNASSYGLYRGGTFLTSTSGLSYTDTSLASGGTTYCYTVTASNSWGISPASVQSCATTIPNPPTNVSATPTSQSSTSISWSASNGATNYIVTRAGYGTVYSGSGTTASDSGLSAGTSYGYYVTASNTAGTSGNSATAGATTDACTPNAPTVSVSASGGTETVSWVPQGCSATGFNTSMSPVTYGQLTSGTSVTYGFSGTYAYCVNAYVTTNGRMYTSSNACTSSITVPAQPGTPTVTPASQTTMSISWAGASYASGYYVYRNGSNIGSTTGTSWNDSGLACGTTYTYFIQAYNNGTGIPSSSASGTTDACSPPLPPTAPSASLSGSTGATVTFSTVSGASGYIVYGYKVGVAQTVSINIAASPANFANLDPGSQYYFYYQAYVTTNGRSYGSGYSPNSNTITTPPPSVTTLTTGINSSNLTTLSWTAVTGSTSYDIYRNSSYIANTAGTSYADQLSCGGSNYSYYIIAKNAGGSSGNSNTSSVTTVVCAPGTPTTPTVTPSNQSQINVSWTAVSGATGYYIYRGGSYIGNTGGTSYTDTSLSCGTGYSYTIVAYNAGGSSAQSAGAGATTDQCTPGTFTIGTAISTSQTNVSVSYTANAPLTATYLNVYGNGTLLSSSPYTVGSPISIGGLSIGTNYYFSIAACVNTNGRNYCATQSGNSNTITTDAATPGTPSAVSGSATGRNTATISWTRNTPADESYFQITTSPASITTGSIPAGSTSYGIGSLACGTAYTASIQAYVNTNGRQYWSGTGTSASFTTSACDVTPPTVSFSPTSSGWATSASITPTASDPSGVSYVWHCWTNSGTSCATATSGGSTFTNGSALAPSGDGSWYLCVTAQDSYGNKNPSPICGGPYNVDTTAPAPNPETISSATATGQTSANIVLSAGSDGSSGLNASAYGLSINGGAYTWYPSNTINLTTLTPGTPYTVYGEIRDAVGNTTSAGSASFTTDSQTPGIPVITGATETSASNTTVSWTASAPMTQSGFYVYTYLTSNNSLVNTTQIASPLATSGSISGLTCGTQYYFTVVAYTNGGNGRSWPSTASSVSATFQCLVAPTTASANNLAITQIPGWPQVNVAITQANSSISGYAVVLNGTTIDTGTSNVTPATSLPNVSGLTCPKNYTASVYAYTIDPSLKNATSPTCSGVNLLSAGNKKCSPVTTVTVPVNYCTQGFFQN